jgi:hypothetical protein
MLKQYQDAILLMNELLSDKGHEKEIEELRKALAEFEKELNND